MISADTANILSVIFGVGLVIIAIGLIARYNLKTILIAREITLNCRKENVLWSLWNTKTMTQFVFSPNELIQVGDPDSVVKGKKNLICHRKAMWPTIFLSWASIFLAFVSVVLFQMLSQ